jgi:hypothetical protein
MVPGDYLLNGARDMPGIEETGVEEIRAYEDKENCSKDQKSAIKKIGKLCGSQVYHSHLISLIY